MKPGNAGGGRSLSSRPTQDVVRDLDNLGQVSNSEEGVEICRRRYTQAKAEAGLSVLRPIREASRDVFWRRPMPSAAPTRARRVATVRTLRISRRNGGRAVAWRTGACAQAGDLPAGADQSVGRYRRPTAALGRSASRPCGTARAATSARAVTCPTCCDQRLPKTIVATNR